MILSEAPTGFRRQRHVHDQDRSIPREVDKRRVGPVLITAEHDGRTIHIDTISQRRCGMRDAESRYSNTTFGYDASDLRSGNVDRQWYNRRSTTLTPV